MSVPLFQITEQHRELERLSQESEIDPQTLTDTLEGLEGDFKEKAKSVAAFIENINADAEAIEEAAKLMKMRAQRLRHRADAVKTYLKINMQATGITKISCPWFTITLCKNPPRVDILEADKIPEKFMVWPDPPPPGIDRKKLLDAMKAGENVPGAQIAQDERVDIRV